MKRVVSMQKQIDEDTLVFMIAQDPLSARVLVSISMVVER